MTRTTIAFCVLTAALLVGCEMPFGSEPRDGGEGPGLEPRDEVSIEPGLVATLYAPERVVPGDTFDVSVRVENAAGRTVQFQTRNSCLVRPAVYYGDGPKEGERAEMKGSLVGCLTVITERQVDPGEAETRVYDMEAVLVGSEEESPAPTGDYSLKAEIDWRVDGKDVEETLEAGFSVVSDG